jgi:putative NADPH-quinone reductase
MATPLVYYAHPGHKYSHVNRYMARAAAAVDGVTFVDLYRDYPRFDINVNVEQQRLLDHDVVLFQFRTSYSNMGLPMAMTEINWLESE